MKQALIIGASALVALGIGASLSIMVFRDDPIPPQSAEIPAPPPAETFAAVFEPCAHCHQIGPGARTTSGPVLTDIIGKPAASGDYPYSEAMRSSGLVWDDETLRAFLLKPSAVVPDTRMRYVGIDPAQLDALMAFLAAPKPD